MHMACSIFINPLGGIFSNMIGRRRSFILFISTGLLGFVTIALSPNIPALFVGRFMTIVCASGLAPNIGVYIVETVHSSVRGTFAVFNSMFVSIGMLVVFGFGYFVSDWRTLAWICIAPGCSHLLVVIFLPDTPYWLAERRAKDDVIKSLQFYRGPDFDISAELDEIIQRKEAKDLEMKAGRGNGFCSAFWRLFSPAFFRPFIAVGVIQLLNNFGVYIVLLLNMITIFKDAKSSIEPELALVFVGIVQVIFPNTLHTLLKNVKISQGNN
jgi:MFS family permease